MADPSPLPERPRLAERVQARMHVASGSAKVVLHDPRTGLMMEIAPADWRVLEHADGTRDVDGLQLALAKGGEPVREADVLQLLHELNGAGVLDDGLAPRLLPALSSEETTPDDRPLDVLPDFALICDGRGSCCRFYSSVGFLPIEALRARLLAKDMDLRGIEEERLFMPVNGFSSPHPEMPVTVAQIDGRCFFLEDDLRCGIHRRAGAEAKPNMCRNYPATFVDDGVALRVSLGPECACVFASVGVPGGSPLVTGAATRGELDPLVALTYVPDPVPVSAMKTAPRELLHAWSRTVHDRARVLPGDAAGWAWALAASIERDGLTDIEVAPAPLDGIKPWLAALRERAEVVASTHEGWRDVSDLSRIVARWVADALKAPDVSATATDPEAERFYLAALAFGHRLASEGRALADGLRDRATRIVTARAMAAIEAPAGSSAGHPLALLEGAMRNLGIAGYMDRSLYAS